MVNMLTWEQQRQLGAACPLNLWHTLHQVYKAQCMVLEDQAPV